MKQPKIIPFLFIGGAALVLANLCLFLNTQETPKPKVAASGIVSQNYMGPTAPTPGKPYLVRVELLIKDSPDLAGVQIQSVTFNGQEIPLKPRDIFGKRGSASFQLPPGTYILRWTVNRDKIVWPRTVSHEEEVIIDPRDLWVQILVQGNDASIL